MESCSNPTQTLLWSMEFVIHINLKLDITGISALARS